MAHKETPRSATRSKGPAAYRGIRCFGRKAECATAKQKNSLRSGVGLLVGIHHTTGKAGSMLLNPHTLEREGTPLWSP